MIPFPNGRPRRYRYSILPFASRGDLILMWICVGLCVIAFGLLIVAVTL